jgi:hypothetical protein
MLQSKRKYEDYLFMPIKCANILTKKTSNNTYKADLNLLGNNNILTDRDPSVLEKHNASIFRFRLSLLAQVDTEDGDITFLQNVSKYLPLTQYHILDA